MDPEYNLETFTHLLILSNFFYITTNKNNLIKNLKQL